MHDIPIENDTIKDVNITASGGDKVLKTKMPRHYETVHNEILSETLEAIIPVTYKMDMNIIASGCDKVLK